MVCRNSLSVGRTYVSNVWGDIKGPSSHNHGNRQVLERRNGDVPPDRSAVAGQPDLRLLWHTQGWTAGSHLWSSIHRVACVFRGSFLSEMISTLIKRLIKIAWSAIQ